MNKELETTVFVYEYHIYTFTIDDKNNIKIIIYLNEKEMEDIKHSSIFLPYKLIDTVEIINGDNIDITAKSNNIDISNIKGCASFIQTNLNTNISEFYQAPKEVIDTILSGKFNKDENNNIKMNIDNCQIICKDIIDQLESLKNVKFRVLTAEELQARRDRDRFEN